MHPLSIISLSVIMMALSINLLGLWSGSARQSNYKNIEVEQRSNLLAQKSSNDECDFTAYQPVRESHFVQRTVRKKVKPIYPHEAATRSVQGWVNVKILINRDGNVEKARAVDGDQTLKNAAEKAALQWKFKPYFGAANAAKTGSRNYMVDVIAFNFDLEPK
jgi:TonB family protein